MTELESLQKQRQVAKGNITRIKNLVSSTMPIAELECRLALVEAYFKQLLKVQSNIEQANPLDTARAELEDLCITTKAKIIELLGDNYRRSSLDQSIAIPFATTSKLPSIDLPKFDGKYSNYKNFISSFKQFVDKDSSLSKIEKFNHLLHCLDGQALDTVRAFEVSVENYDKALKRLQERYDNKTLIFLEHIQNLYDLQSVQKANGSKLRSLIDSASAIYSSLKSLGNEEEIGNALIIHIIMQKTDVDSQIKWKESLDFSKLPSWTDYCKHLERRCQFLESSESQFAYQTNTHSHHKQIRTNHHQQRQNNRSLFHTQQQRSCGFCKSLEHWISDCKNLQSLTFEHRFNTVKRLGLCINCLNEGHTVNKCKSKNKCKICHKSHHTLLHRPAHETPQQNIVQSGPVYPSTSTASINVHFGNSTHVTILATALILVKDYQGGWKICRALLDSCSQVNLISENFARLLQLPKQKTSVNILGVGNSTSKIKYETRTTIRSRCNASSFFVKLYIANRISGYQPDLNLDIENWNLPSNITLADEHFNKSQPIDMLLGADTFFESIGVDKIKLGSSLPYLQETSFGYIVSGTYKTFLNNTNFRSYNTVAHEEYDSNLNQQLELLWSMEKVSSLPVKRSSIHQICEDHFKNHVSITDSGRIQVMLPFKDDPVVLGASQQLALKRFLLLEKRLERDNFIKQQYVDFMREYEQLGHMTQVEPNLSEPHFYLPHQYVLKPNSLSTKLRVVFDASAKTSSMKSLNDILCTGPTIQDDLFLLLLKFRLWKYALTADISEMYRMVLLHPQHRQFQQILWRENENQPIRTYQLNTVTYGMSASPFLAIRSLHYLADQFQELYTIGSHVIKNQFYVDDLLSGANDLSTLSRIKTETTSLLSEAGFILTKFNSNNSNFRLATTETKLNNMMEPAITSALGITWDSIADQFRFSFKPKKQYSTITKRSILSLISSIFDPMGLVCPLMIQARVLMQDLWISKIDWDTEVPQQANDLFLSFLDDLENLHLIQISRFVFQPDFVSLQLHGFSDASIRAYGCCFYVRTIDSSGNIYVQLLTAKSRIAPTKKKTIPQLELCGAHLLAKLYSKICPIFGKVKPQTFLWTDSTVVLQWLQKHSSTLVTFIGNRISDIQEETEGCIWRHIPTSCNPADIISRGCTVKELATSIWLQGPSFLQQPMENWPKTILIQDDPMVNSALRKVVFNCQIYENPIIKLTNRISSYNRLLRITCRMYRFKNNTRDAEITTEELRKSLLCIIWNIQQHYFIEEYKLLKKNLPIKNSLKSLSLFIEEVDNFSIIRVGGRLENADIPYDRKHPFLLPKHSNFVDILVRHYHVSNFHAGPNALMSFIRQTFWIIGARTTTRKIVRSCPSCIRYRPKLLTQVMSPLPVSRVTVARPFENCGVDFCGPIYTYLKIRGKQPYKCYVAIFICFSTKAVHIEAVSDLSSEAFIAALKRLIGRRGIPANIFCDNATNFVGANAKLIDLKKSFTDKSYQNNVSNFCSKHFIKFNFIPPRAPHFGGLWEAAVKSAKGYLFRTLSNAKMTYEELSTTLIEIEAVMNSRPISALSSDPNDLEALTPGHLLIGAPLNALPARNIECHEISYLERWKRITAVKQHFWKKWSSDYLNELIQKTRWPETQINLHINSLVLVHEENMPPMKWPLGRIVQFYPGTDGKIRVADVKTASGLFRRPIHKLALLLNP